MNIVTLEDVKHRIDDILENAHDDEAAHSMENALHQDVLYTIAQNILTREQMALLALQAIRTKAIDFSRWCA